MKTRQQKEKEVQKGKELLGKAQSVLFVDFSKTPVSAIGNMKKALRDIETTYHVIKKRLLNLVLKDKGIDVDVKQFSGQVGTVFSPKDISDPAGVVFRFSKDLGNESFQLLGGFDIASQTFFGGEDIMRIGKLPSRSILIAQIAGLVKTPVTKLAYVLSQIAEGKGSGEAKEAPQEEKAQEAPVEEKKEETPQEEVQAPEENKEEETISEEVKEEPVEEEKKESSQ